MFCYVFLLNLCMCPCSKWLPSTVSYSSFETCSSIIFCVVSNLTIPDLCLSFVTSSILCAQMEFYALFFVIFYYNNLCDHFFT